MDQWFNDTLVAIDFIAEGYGYWRIWELPARTTCIQRFPGKFFSLERAEQVVSEQWPGEACIVVDPLDLVEEVERRKVVLVNKKARDEE
jgi:hypothetical protein